MNSPSGICLSFAYLRCKGRLIEFDGGREEAEEGFQDPIWLLARVKLKIKNRRRLHQDLGSSVLRYPVSNTRNLKEQESTFDLEIEFAEESTSGALEYSANILFSAIFGVY